MNQAEASAAITAAFQAVHTTIGQTEDPEQRQLALLRCFGRNAEIHAATFVDHVLETGHRADDDLAARAQAAIDPVIDMLLRNNERMGLDFPEFAQATRQVFEAVFFDRINKAFALVIKQPAGPA